MSGEHRQAPGAVVVGAGPAGPACARDLCRAGRRVTLREASDGVDGRTRTDRRYGLLLDRATARHLRTADHGASRARPDAVRRGGRSTGVRASEIRRGHLGTGFPQRSVAGAVSLSLPREGGALCQMGDPVADMSTSDAVRREGRGTGVRVPEIRTGFVPRPGAGAVPLPCGGDAPRPAAAADVPSTDAERPCTNPDGTPDAGRRAR